MEILNTAFSTADAENVSIKFSNGDLYVNFIDWQEKQKEILFIKTLAFSWYENSQETDDGCFQVMDSEWTKQHPDHDEVSNNKNYKHYRFIFNYVGKLDVIAINFKIIK